MPIVGLTVRVNGLLVFTFYTKKPLDPFMTRRVKAVAVDMLGMIGPASPSNAHVWDHNVMNNSTYRTDLYSENHKTSRRRRVKPNIQFVIDWNSNHKDLFRTESDYIRLKLYPIGRWSLGFSETKSHMRLSIEVTIAVIHRMCYVMFLGWLILEQTHQPTVQQTLQPAGDSHEIVATLN